MVNRPVRKQDRSRGWEPLGQGGKGAGSGSRELAGRCGSTSAPRLTAHRVATAMTNQWRSARWGTVRRVACHCQPPRLMYLKLHSIQARKLYHTILDWFGGRSVRISQGSL